MKKVRGFTLIELMITVAVLAILVGLGVPSFRDFIVGSRLTTQTNELVAAINLGRSEAVKRNRAISFCRTTTDTATACANTTGTWEHWIILAGANEVVRRGNLPRFNGNLRVTSSLPADRLIFAADGLARTTGGNLTNNETFTICAFSGPTQGTRRITLGAGSRVSTEVLVGGCS